MYHILCIETGLRDDRIKQFVGSGRGLMSTMRQQADRHAAELIALREQIMVIIGFDRVEYFTLNLLFVQSYIHIVFIIVIVIFIVIIVIYF